MNATERHEYFDWSLDWEGLPAFTTDPEWVGKLRYGRHNVVTCNGIQIHYATRYVTGPQGWVEYQIRDANGQPVEEPEGQVKAERVYGRVKFYVLES